MACTKQTLRGRRGVETYERMAELAAYAESIQSIRKALTEEGRPLGQFSADFESRHGIKR
jgi:hypothetical protein